MKCIKATDYGFRTVVVVCHNPNDPEYLHDDESVHPPENVNGCPDNDAGVYICHYNHRLEEFIWDGEDQYEDGILRTAESFWAEICDKCV